MASVTVNLTGYIVADINSFGWTDDVLLGSAFDANGMDQTLTAAVLWHQGGAEGQVSINLVGPNDRFTPAFEATGRIIFTASDGETLEVMIANAAMSEPYIWTPTNSAEVIAFANHVRGLTDQNATLTLSDDPPVDVPDAPAAPTFTNITHARATGNWVEPNDNGADITSYDLQWRQGTSGSWTDVADLTGTSHTLTGLDANTAYQARVRATNSEGDSDWSDAVDWTTTANSSPVVTITTSGQTVNGNSVLALEASATDTDSDTLTYLWSANPDVGSFDDSGAANTNYNVPPPITSNRPVTLTLTVTDPHGGSGDDDIDITVRQNAAPTVTINTPDSIVASEQAVSMSSSIFDTDHRTNDLTILWTAGQGDFNNASVANPTWTAPAVTAETSVVLTLSVDDGVAAAVTRTVTMTVKPPLSLSDYDQSGKQFDLLALIEADSRNDVFQQASLTDRGTLVDGEVGVGPDETILERIRITPSATRIILRDGDVNADGDAAVLDSRDYFINGDGSDLTIGIMTLDGSVDINIADNIDTSSGTNATQVRVDIPSDDRSVVNGIDDGDRFIIALWRIAPARIQATAASGAPLAAAQVRTTAASEERIQAPASSGIPVAQARVRLDAPGAAQVQAAVSTGIPTVAARVRATPPVSGLSLADIAIPTGRVLSGAASLIGIGASGDVYNTSDATIIDGADPPNLGAASLNATRIYVTGNPQLRISEDGAGDIGAIFSTGGAQEDYQIHVQTSATAVLSYGSSDVDAGRSTGARILLGANNDPQDLLAPISALVSGDRVIWFLSEPEPSPTAQVQATISTGIPTATARIRTQAGSVSTPEVILDSLQDLQAAFDNVEVGSDGGRWKASVNQGTPTDNTGPGTNNVLDFVHTETSGLTVSQIADGEARGIIDMQSDEIPDGDNRTLRLRLCITGDFGTGEEGFEVLTRVDDDDSWVQADFIYGWAYSNNYNAGDTFDDENDVERTVAADGGWVDFEVSIPDTAGQIQFRPHYIHAEGEQLWQHDIAFRSFSFAYRSLVGLSAQVQADVSSGVPIASARVRTTPGANSGQVRATGTSGVPVASAQIRLDRMAQVRASAASGTPTALARVRTTLPGTAQVMADAASGVPSVTARVRTTPPILPDPAFFLAIDWAGDGTFSHADSDVSDDVVADIDCSRGRGDYGSQLFGRSEAGILRTRLLNDSGKYDILNVTTTLGSLITTLRLVRLSMSYPNVARTTLWTGYLDNIAGKERRGGRDTIGLLALGTLALLQDARPVIPAAQDESIGSILQRLIEASVPGLDNSLVVSTREIPYWSKPSEQTALAAARELAETEFGPLREHRDGRLVLEDRNYRLTSSAASSITIADDGTGDAATAEITPILRAQDLVNIVRVPVRSFSAGASAVLWAAADVTIPAGSRIRLRASYPGPTAPRENVGVSAWTLLAAGTDYTAQTDLTVTSESQGDELLITLVNAGAADAVLPTLQARGAPLIADDVLIIEERDQSSIDEYDDRPFPAPSQWIPTVTEARSYALAILNVHSEPRRRVIDSWFVSDAPALALSVDLSDRITVQERDASIDYFIETIRLRIKRGAAHLVTYTLSPALPFGNTAVFGTAVFGTHRFGY